MTDYLRQLLILCPLVFLAGFIDSVAGGGGIITLPAYIVAGLPIHMAYGTNKFSASIGTCVATVNYARGGYIAYRPALCSVVGALVGSWCGAKLVLFLDETVLRYCLLGILPVVACFLLFNRGFGKEKPEEQHMSGTKLYVAAALIGLVVGTYDGFFGPGTGTFLTLAFTGILGFSLVTASGNARACNLASNTAALAVYVMDGKVLYPVGVPAAVCAIAGNYLGARLAVRLGARFIRVVLIISVALLFGYLVYEFL